MNNKEILEYLRTIIIALLISLVIAGIATACSKVIAEHHVRMISKISNTAKDNKEIDYLIEKFKHLEKEYPGDYSINVKLANLYELKFDYISAEKNYKKAIEKSPYGVYSSYLGLANLYVKLGKYNKALNIVRTLKNTDHKPLLIAKGDFYLGLGDALWMKGQFENAVKQYKIAYFYYKKVDSNKKNQAINSILSCYNEIADYDFKHRDIEHAIESLETALVYKETPIVTYKLAVLYKDIDPVKANIYMEKTYEKDPGLINFSIYEEILFKLINFYDAQSDFIKRELYQHKLKSIFNFQKRYIITENDVKIEIESLKVIPNIFRTKETVKVKYKILNNSQYDFNTLYITVKIRYDDKYADIYSEKFYSKKQPLKSRTESNTYKFAYSYKENSDIFLAKNLDLIFYASKKDNMRKIPVKVIDLRKK